jgi:signal transduction histidine kinase
MQNRGSEDAPRLGRIRFQGALKSRHDSPLTVCMGPGLRVVLVEDDRAFASLVTTAVGLSSDPVQVTTAGTLAEAIRELDRTEADAVLLDLNLPDSRGLATLHAVLSVVRARPIVVLTGLDDMALAREAVTLGAQDWLIKGEVDGELLSRSLRYAVERKKLTDSLLRAQKLEVIGRLAAGVAHEFNNALTAIMGSARLIELSDDTDTRAEGLSLLRKSAEQGAALSRQILSLARNPPVNDAVYSTRTLMENVAGLLHAVAPSSVRVEIGPIADLPVRVDPGQFDQLLLNLALNARDAMPKGGVLRITIAREPPADHAAPSEPALVSAVIRVRDTGVGIDPSLLPHIFDPFFTTKPDTGTGLGLAICAEMLERFGGAIHATSELGSGATFIVHLPVVAGGEREWR